jgi:hypothetical protein
MAYRWWSWCVLLLVLGTAEFDREPLWVAYPRDQHPEFMDAAHDTTWTWQLRTLVVQ